MKILHISSVPIEYPGGTEKVIWELAKRQSINNKVTILQTNLYMQDKKMGTEKNGNVTIINCKNNLWLGGFGFSIEFTKELKNIWENYDIIHIHGHGRFTSTYALSFLHNKKPVIYSAQGFFHKKNIIKNIYDVLFGGLLKNADVCTALTELEVEHLENKFGIKKDKISILPGGIDLKKFKKPSLTAISSFKKKYNISGKTLLYVGRIHESKGLQYVIGSIKDMSCKLLIIGKDAGYKSKLTEQIKDLKISDRVMFVENLDDKDVVLAYHSSNAFILFSDWEGFGIVVIEAMSSGLPVVVSNNGALPYLVKDNKNGYVAKNEKELKNKINIAFMRNKEIIDNARNFSKQFSWDNIKTRSMQIYENAIKK